MKLTTRNKETRVLINQITSKLEWYFEEINIYKPKQNTSMIKSIQTLPRTVSLANNDLKTVDIPTIDMNPNKIGPKVVRLSFLRPSA